uniref:Putative zinc finger protein n=1 Tax=Ixodes ricinus TaxID=34613 RepID=A0A0K8RHG7_IXORI
MYLFTNTLVMLFLLSQPTKHSKLSNIAHGMPKRRAPPIAASKSFLEGASPAILNPQRPTMLSATDTLRCNPTPANQPTHPIRPLSASALPMSSVISQFVKYTPKYGPSILHSVRSLNHGPLKNWQVRQRSNGKRFGTRCPRWNLLGFLFFASPDLRGCAS